MKVNLWLLIGWDKEIWNKHEQSNLLWHNFVFFSRYIRAANEDLESFIEWVAIFNFIVGNIFWRFKVTDLWRWSTLVTVGVVRQG